MTKDRFVVREQLNDWLCVVPFFSLREEKYSVFVRFVCLSIRLSQKFQIHLMVHLYMKISKWKTRPQLIKYRSKIFVLSYKKSFDISKSLIVSLYRRTDNARARGKKTKGQTTIYKTLHRKQKIEQYESGSGCSGRVGSSCANSCTHLVTNPVISHEWTKDRATLVLAMNELKIEQHLISPWMN